MTTPPIQTLTDELLGEIEAAALDSKVNIYRPLGWGHSVRCGNHLQTDFDFLSLVSPATVHALITELRTLRAENKSLQERIDDPDFAPKYSRRLIESLRAENASMAARIEELSTPYSRTCERMWALESENAELRKDATRSEAAYNAVIDYMLGAGYCEEPLNFLHCWNEGDFDCLRDNWPEAPIAIYYADSQADHSAIDTAMEQTK